MDVKKLSTAISASDYELHKHEYDPNTFTHEPYVKEFETPWGKQINWTPPGLDYIGNELQIDEGKKIDVTESDRFRILVIRDGKATINLEDKDGKMISTVMEYGKGFRIHTGQKFSIETDGKTRIIEGAEKEASKDAPNRDKFTTEAYVAVDDSKPWGNEPIFSRKSEGDPIAMKILHLNKDGWLSLQAHAVKVESYYMSYGECDMVMENTNSELEEFPLEFDKGYTTKVGQRHRHKGKTEMDVFEVSTPEDGSTTWRIEDKYARGDQTDEVRRKERGDI